MDKLIIPSPSNGIPFNWDDLDFAYGNGSYEGGTIQAIEGTLKQYGDDFVVSGCEVTGSTVASGWVMLGGELIKVDSHTKTDDYYIKVVTYNSDGNKQDKIAGNVQTYQQNRATSTASSGDLKYDNRLNGSYTSVAANVSYTKIKLNEIISASSTDTEVDITLGTGKFEGDTCTVIMDVSGDGGGIDVLGTSNLFRLEGNYSSGSCVKTFKYINGAWLLKDDIPNARTDQEGIQKNATSTEGRSGTSTSRSMTPNSTSDAVRHLSQVISSTGTVSVSDGVGYVQIDGTATVTLKLPGPTGEDGLKIRLLNLSGNSATIQTYAGVSQTPGTVTTDEYSIWECDGTQWICVYHASRP